MRNSVILRVKRNKQKIKRFTAHTKRKKTATTTTTLRTTSDNGNRSVQERATLID